MNDEYLIMVSIFGHVFPAFSPELFQIALAFLMGWEFISIIQGAPWPLKFIVIGVGIILTCVFSKIYGFFLQFIKI